MAGRVTPQQPVTNQPTHMSAKRRRMLTVLTAVFLILGVLWSIYWMGWGRFHEYTEDAYVGGNQVQLMPQVGGTVVSISTDNTHLVTQGQTLVKLDEADTSVALQNAAANLAQTVRQVRQYYENVRSGLAGVALRQANLEKAKYDVKRRVGLVNARAISAEDMQHIKTAEQTAKAQLEVSLANLSAAIALVENAHLYQHPLVEQAKANLRVAFLNWVRTIINAPATGYVAKRAVQVGQQVNPGTALLAIIPLDQVWVDANFKESQLGRIRIGQDVILTADANSGVTYHGKVVGLSPGTGSAFDLLPPQNATGNWIKIVQRLPVRISLDPDEVAKHPLRIGLSMRVTVHTRDLKGDVLTRAPDEKPLFTTDVYNNQLANAETLINKIVTANSPDVVVNGLPKTSGKQNA